MSGIERRLKRLEDSLRPRAPEDERERQKWHERIREAAEGANRRRRLDGKGLVFKIAEDGDVFCTHDGRPVTKWRQTLAEEWYWQELEWGCPLGLLHDEEGEAFYTLGGELAISRYLVDLRHALGPAREARNGREGGGS